MTTLHVLVTRITSPERSTNPCRCIGGCSGVCRINPTPALQSAYHSGPAELVPGCSYSELGMDHRQCWVVIRSRWGTTSELRSTESY